MSAALQAEQKRVTTGYVPRALQAELHLKVRRFSVIVCHRRFGKTVWSINHMLDRGLRNPLKNPRYAYVAPLYGQAKRVAWDYLKEYALKIPGAFPNEADLRVDIPRPHLGDTIRFQLLGADNPVSLKGIYLDGVILDEYAEMDPSAWREVIRPTLSDRLGWAIFVGTPKGRNNFFDLFEYAARGEDHEWFAAIYKASQTKIIPDSELASAQKTMTEEEYNQEYECSFASGLVGAYYGKELERLKAQGKLTAVPYDSKLPVDSYWDLGINDVMAVWFVQRYGREFRHIGYDEASDLSIPEWGTRVKARGYYRMGGILLPHDAAVRDLGTGKSRQETFRSVFGIVPKVLERTEIMDGIHAVRNIFSKSIFDEKACEKGINALANYQRKWDPKRNCFSEKPLHNWASNGADAFRTFAMGVDEREPLDMRNLPREAEREWNPFE